ncbi:EAL domain-containing protein [Tumebacillus sp. DT12]|uniref:EAL domain-containing protein n=1 Tax=Tumebacillus lacus TaxID=2995335 RepID=A0ABT3X217_9BACL|nr:EAL domain-containing protein [Tumebacillus lacus]MCX7570962.1 EAL domain-containing protein [Tumebacillus lacus]
MKRNLVTTQILVRVGFVMAVIGIVTALVTIWFTKAEVENYLASEVHASKEVIASAMDSNQRAAQTVERLVERRLSTVSAAIAKALADKKTADEVSREELEQLKEEFHLFDISLFERKGDDIVITQSTDSMELGLSTKGWGYWHTAFQQLMSGLTVDVGKGYSERHFWVGPISKSEWDDKYLKYAYYYDGTTSYMINPYVLDQELYQLTREFGPSQMIEKLVSENPTIEEIAVINVPAWMKGEANVIVEPDVDTPVLFGRHEHLVPEDREMLEKTMLDGDERHVTFVEDGLQKAKYYLPMDDQRVMALTANYTRHATMERRLVALLAVAFFCCFVIIILTVRVIAIRRLQPLQQIEAYLARIAEGDFSTDLDVRENNELGWLARQISAMAAKLNLLIEEVNSKAQDAITQMAFYDDLTNLPNRRLFKRRLQAAMAEAELRGEMMAVMFLDLDRFKFVNDSLGHTTGDLLLQNVAKRLSGVLPEHAILARMGGDEFTILLPKVEGDSDCVVVARSILDGFEIPLRFDNHEFRLSTSIGIAVYPRDGEDDTTLLKNADAAMYHAKESGRNNFQLYSRTMNATILEQLQLEQSLHQALELEEFVLYYQPQVNVYTGKMIGMEALIRWNHPEHGMISPALFIPIAENTGLIEPIGDWVLRRACRQLIEWQEAGLPPVCVAVNLSARQFQKQNFVEQIAEVLQETGLDPQYLELEVTESLAMTHADRAVSKLYELKHLGVKLSIDDFGTGYSSLNYLKRFPIDTLKIDRSFVGDITSNEGDATIVTTIIAMAHTLEMKVIAEGVENEEQLEFLYGQGCDQMQGYLFSPPRPAEEIEKMLRGGLDNFYTRRIET